MVYKIFAGEDTMKGFSWFKTIRKGIEGAVLGGGAAEAAIQVQQVDMEDIEHAVTVLVIAGVGFIFKAGKNWWKNRGK